MENGSIVQSGKHESMVGMIDSPLPPTHQDDRIIGVDMSRQGGLSHLKLIFGNDLVMLDLIII